MSNRSAAVIVTYEPEPNLLGRLIEVLTPQVRTIFVVDNASTNYTEWRQRLRTDICHTVRLTSNEGIAAALNRGFEQIGEESDLEFCAIFDQDSAPSPDMIDRLEAHYDDLAAKGPVAQIGPYFFERNRNYYLPFIEFKFGFPRRKRDPGNGTWTTADYLISSGALISMTALKTIGKMDESLFIDYVDIEWGLRARAAGYQSYGAIDVRMEHAIGETALNVAGLKLAVHKPIRRYYYYRNALLLCQRSYISIAWKVNEVVRLGVKFFIFAALSRRRMADITMMSKGIGDGLRGKTGKLRESGGRS